MKRFVKWLLGIIIVVIILAIVITPYFLGGVIKSQLKQEVKNANQQLNSTQIKLTNYHRHWWSSDLTLKFKSHTQAGNMADKIIKDKVHLTVHHGPIVISQNPALPHTIYFGLGALTGQTHIQNPDESNIKFKDIKQKVYIGSLFNWSKQIHTYIVMPSYHIKGYNMELHTGKVHIQHQTDFDTQSGQRNESNQRSKWQINIGKSKAQISGKKKNQPVIHLTLNQINWKTGFKGTPFKDWNDVTQLHIPKVTITEDNDKQLGTLDNLMMHTTSKAKSGKISIKQNIKVDNISTMGSQLKPIQLKWSWHNIKEKPLNQLQDVLKNIKKKSNNAQQSFKQTAKLMKHLSKSLANSNGQMALKGKTHLGWIKLHAQAVVDQQSQQGSVPKLDLHGHGKLSLPKALGNPQKAKQQQLTQLLHSVVKMGQARNLLMSHDNKMLMHFKYTKSDQILINGQPLSHYWPQLKQHQQQSHPGHNLHHHSS